MNLSIKKAFDITKDNIIVAQPLIIFFIIITLTTSALMQQTDKILYGVFLIANILLATAFFAGWFYMIKQAIELNKKAENNEFASDKERNSASFALGNKFFDGVGEYFVPVSYTIITYVVVYGLLLFLCYEAGTHFLPDTKVDWNQFMTVANSSVAEMQKYVFSMSYAQIKAVNLWMFYLGSCVSIFAFLTMFLFPALFDKKDFVFFVPFQAFNRNLMFVFKHFFPSLVLLIFIFFLNIILSFLSIIFNINVVLSVIGLLISFYFMTYVMVLVFLYYEDNK